MIQGGLGMRSAGSCRKPMRAVTHRVVRRSGGIMLTDFYISFSAICFTLLGLWLVVVQQRYRAWAGEIRPKTPLVRRRPALVAARDHDVAGAGRSGEPGPVAYVVRDRRTRRLDRRRRGAQSPGTMGKAAYVGAIVLYAVVGIVAIVPHLLRDIGITAAPVRVEAVLLSVLVFLGVNVAWLLLFDEAETNRQRPLPGERARPAPRTPARDGLVRPEPGACSARRRSGPAGGRSLPSPRTGNGGRRTCRRSRARTGR